MAQSESHVVICGGGVIYPARFGASRLADAYSRTWSYSGICSDAKSCSADLGSCALMTSAVASSSASFQPSA